MRKCKVEGNFESTCLRAPEWLQEAPEHERMKMWTRGRQNTQRQLQRLRARANKQDEFLWKNNFTLFSASLWVYVWANVNKWFRRGTLRPQSREEESQIKMLDFKKDSRCNQCATARGKWKEQPTCDWTVHVYIIRCSKLCVCERVYHTGHCQNPPSCH